MVGVFVVVGVLVSVGVTNTPHRTKLSIVPLVSTSTAYSFPPKVNLVYWLLPLYGLNNVPPNAVWYIFTPTTGTVSASLR